MPQTRRPRGSGRSALQRRRVRRGLTQQALADHVGLNRVSIARIETGVAEPTVTTALRIACALDTSVEQLWSKR